MDIQITVTERRQTPTAFSIYDSASKPRITNFGLLDMRELVQLLEALVVMKREIKHYIPKKHTFTCDYAEEKTRECSKLQRELRKLKSNRGYHE